MQVVTSTASPVCEVPGLDRFDGFLGNGCLGRRLHRGDRRGLPSSRARARARAGVGRRAGFLAAAGQPRESDDQERFSHHDGFSSKWVESIGAAHSEFPELPGPAKP
jgi:hypothetical protein